MAYSKISYIGDGSTTSYTTPSYIEKSHIAVWVDGNLSFEHSWTGPNTITFNTAPSAGAVIEIVRNSSQQTRLVNYQQPSPLDAETLNRDSQQAFYMAQEALDEASLALHRTTDGDSYDAEGNPIVNVGSPTNGNDAATKSYVDIAIASGTPGGPITLFTVADYTELRGLTTEAYAANRVFVTDPAPGEFWHDAADTTSADDGGVIIVDASGRRWKRLEANSGYACPTWWGLKQGGDAAENHAAIQACINKVATSGATISKVLFTKKGTYFIDDTLVITDIPLNARFPFHIDLGGSAVGQTTDNIPLIEVWGGIHSMWKIENGRLFFYNTQPTTNTDAFCIAFGDNPADGTTVNGPHNGVISRISFERCHTSIGIRDRPTDVKFDIWDVRIEYCTFSGFSQRAINIHPTPTGSTGAKNITIRSCYINDESKNPGGASIIYAEAVRVLNIDDLEVIQVARPVLQTNQVYCDIRSVSIENSTPTPIDETCPHLFYFLGSTGTIHSISFESLQMDGFGGTKMPLMKARGLDSSHQSRITVGSVELWRLKSITGNFVLFGGNQYGGFVLTSPPYYSSTPVDVCPLFNYNVADTDAQVSGQSYLTYYGHSVYSVTHTTGAYSSTVTPALTNLVVLGVPTGNITIDLYPKSGYGNMGIVGDIGRGTYVTVRRVNTGPYTFTVDWGGSSLTIPADKKGFVTLAWVYPDQWTVVEHAEF